MAKRSYCSVNVTPHVGLDLTSGISSLRFQDRNLLRIFTVVPVLNFLSTVP
jgi:hypothetical protein